MSKDSLELRPCGLCEKLVLINTMHNAMPIANIRCCTECNYKIVIPERLSRLTTKDRKENTD